MDASSALSIAGTLWLLTAATFAGAYEGWARLDPERPLRPWLYGIAANLVRHHWRHERRMLRAYARTGADPVFADESDALDRVEARASRRELAAALAELRPRDREILLLRAWADLSDAEIADALSLPIGTVNSRGWRLTLPREHPPENRIAWGLSKQAGGAD